MIYHKHHFKINIAQYLLVFVVLSILIGVASFGSTNRIHEVINVINKERELGILVYLVYSIVSTVIAPIPTMLLWPVALLVYGFLPTVILSIFGCLVGAIINFMIARRFGKQAVIRMIGKKLYDELNHIVNTNNAWTFTLIRLLSNNYFDTVSYIAGLSKLSLKTYTIVTLVVSSIWITAQLKMIQLLGGLENLKSFLSIMGLYGVIIIFGTLVWEYFHKVHTRGSRR